MVNRFKERLKSNRGNAILIMGLAIFGLILLMAIFFVDVSKNIYISNNYTQMAQRATQTALKQQNSIGGLTPQAATAVINEYLEEREPKTKCASTDGSGNTVACQTVETKAFRTLCAKKYPNYPEIEVAFSTARNNKGKTSSTDNFGVTLSYKNGSIPEFSPAQKRLFYRNQYKTIRVKVKDYGDNYFFSMFGRGCEVYNIQTSAIAMDATAGDTGK